MSDDNERNWLVYLLVAVGSIVALVFCGGVVAGIAIPQFVQTVKETKASEAEATLESTVAAIESYYHRNGSIPGVGTRLRTCERVPVGGQKVQIRRRGLTEQQREVWETLGWPSSGNEMYFQYAFQAEETSSGSRADVVARADFVEGGAEHTVRVEISLADGTLTASPIVTENEFE